MESHEHPEIERRFDRLDDALNGITEILVAIARIEERQVHYEAKFADYDRAIIDGRKFYASQARTGWVVGNIERVIWVAAIAAIGASVGLVRFG